MSGASPCRRPKGAHAVPPAMVGLDAIIVDAQQPHPAPKLLRPRAAPIAELVGPEAREQRAAADSLDKAEKAFIEQGKVERDSPLGCGCLQRPRLGREPHAPDPIKADDVLSAK